MSKQQDFHSLMVTGRLGAKNQWVELAELVRWSRFEKLLTEVDETGPEGGRPRYDVTVMFRMVLLGQWHDLSDREVEEALRVRLDFMVFCGLNLSSEVPDQNTVQLFRSKLTEKGLLPRCLKLLNEELARLNLKVATGRLVIDSTIIRAAARPRNIVTVDTDSNDDQGPASGAGTSTTLSTSADRDAAWTVKGKQFYGSVTPTV
jgi:IS5 family transposase